MQKLPFRRRLVTCLALAAPLTLACQDEGNESDTDAADETTAVTGTSSPSSNSSSVGSSGGSSVGGETTTGESSDGSSTTDSTTAASGTADESSSGTPVDYDCVLDPPSPVDSGDLIVEPCTIEGPPLRGQVIGVAIDVDGSILVNLNADGSYRFMDDAESGCHLVEAPLGDVPVRPFAGWGPVEVVANGTTYVVRNIGGPADIAWSGSDPGSCEDLPGELPSHELGFSEDGRAVSGRVLEGSPLLYDLNNCTTTTLDAMGDANAAMFYDDDVILRDGSHLERWTTSGQLVWDGEALGQSIAFGAEVVRCGDDVCIRQGGGAVQRQLQRYSGVDGSPAGAYSTADLFGVDQAIDDLGRSPDEEEIVVSFEVEHPDPACKDDENVLLYRVRGF